MAAASTIVGLFLNVVPVLLRLVVPERAKKELVRFYPPRLYLLELDVQVIRLYFRHCHCPLHHLVGFYRECQAYSHLTVVRL